MKTYKNLSGNSGIATYETGRTFIKIKFKGESGIYIYDYDVPGRQMVEEMKTLALKGQGLSTYILEEVGNNYSGKK